ncbi:glutamine-hydrolyzing GMP synthase [Candidatus Micrarchaeota archaeon]|nr:glutamine-hydrolyzing GMP synthase [Candidatus Micrarchaeota archaeon]
MAILVLNCGSQFVHLIPRRIRELGAYAEILPCDADFETIGRMSPKGIVISGGPASVYEKDAPQCDPRIYGMGIPVLGVCYGQQLMGRDLGGEVKGHEEKQFGRASLQLNADGKKSLLFEGWGEREDVWFSHGDAVEKLPPGFEALASTPTCKIAAMADATRNLYAVQFHPEVVHTPKGMGLYENFVFKICKEEKSWTMSDLKGKLVGELKAKLGNERAVIGISGGVDSLVAATLLHNAIGDNLQAIFVNTGLLRKNEVEDVSSYLRKHGFSKLVVADARHQFLSKLAGVTDPEEKRRIIGHTFIEVFDGEIAKLETDEKIKFLAQGTIYPDRIESAQPSKHAQKIKSHHNLTLPAQMRFQIIEPLRDLYKDEVRKLGESLGLPKELLWRHPFPGPGLAIRILGEIDQERLRILREADAIFIEELKASGWYGKTWQAFVALLPVKAVGVMGDARTYSYVISLRAVQSVDGMTADWVKLPYELLERVSSRIVNEVRGVNRVVYDVTQKPPGTIEYL